MRFYDSISSATSIQQKHFFTLSQTIYDQLNKNFGIFLAAIAFFLRWDLVNDEEIDIVVLLCK